MRTQEYNRITKERNVLDFGTLKETKKQLEINKLTELESEIDRIIKENKIQKPELHNEPNSTETNFFLIDLNSDQIEIIVSIFGDLEVGNLGLNYESTYSANFFAKMLDKWSNLPDYR
ncbi:hypothetical protein PG913_08725 [Tenacibaculum pacificus]|uniref:hypothetical protein n=1 Tax=Tenacibaculum pacificus TaxID=3018314 RepID=UPI0022F3D7FA|nr:hypothetical protein [Tenacibaculum pacificus]WBX72857.1 hypothetical protein PG913_08055 [Tenacibaculum pacificus]WBX72978.1 hypothetical protein PG913_08725 [Tenacibaculum pacificus]